MAPPARRGPNEPWRNDQDGEVAENRPALPPIASIAVTGTAATTLATFLPWASSGARTRTSYEIVDVVERAGVLSDSTEALAGLWYLVPIVCGLALVGVAIRSVRLVTLTAGTLGLTVVAGGMLVARSPLGAEPGLYLAAGLGVVTIASGIGTQIMTKRRRT